MNQATSIPTSKGFADTSIDLDAIPLELRDMPQWVCWRLVLKKGAAKPTKVPIHAKNPADMLVFDELDEATPDAKSLAKERLAHSDYKRIIELSNPSIPNYGIDEAYQLSDQRHWTIRCDGCGTWTALPNLMTKPPLPS